MFDMYGNFAFWVSLAIAIVVILIIFKTAVIVPQQSAYVVESLGKYSRTLRAGFHILIPFIETAAYKHSLKELALDDFLRRGEAVDGAEVEERLAQLSSDDLCDIMYTSGTTGAPKGVMSAHGQVVAIFETWSAAVGLGENDRYLIVNPFFHTFGYKSGWLSSIMRGATILPQPVFDVETVLGRRRYIPELSSNNWQDRQYGERISANTPIQGSAADICKLAMLAIEAEGADITVSRVADLLSVLGS